MSKLVSALEAIPSKDRRFKKQKLFNTVVDFDSRISKEFADHIEIQTRYSLVAKFGTNVWIDDRLADVQLPQAMRETQRAVTEAVFGEFRTYFRELNIALLENRYEDMYEILDRFEKQMFNADSFE
jgi:hypothetical protein